MFLYLYVREYYPLYFNQIKEEIFDIPYSEFIKVKFSTSIRQKCL